MSRFDMVRRVSWTVLAATGLLAATGCARHFTREHYEMVTPGVDGRFDVEQMLGKPDFRADDVWHYRDLDHHYEAQIYFGPDDKVVAKEWMDGKTGTWEGSSPDAQPFPEGEARERHTRTRRIHDD